MIRRLLQSAAIAALALGMPALADDAPNPHIAAMYAAAQGGQPARAVAEADLVIAAFEARYNKPNTLYLCGQTPAETIANMAMAANARKDGVAISPDWCSAHYVKGFALIDLAQPQQAEMELRRATEMAPFNAHFLNEYAELIKSRREWQRSYDMFAQAEGLAQFYPVAGRAAVHARSLRGMGFTKIELGDLAGAEQLFNRSLKLQPNHPAALAELRYIAQQRQQQGAK